MPEEVAHVVQFRLGLQQAAGELTAQVMKTQAGDTRPLTRREPRLVRLDDALAHGAPEHECLRAELFAVGI